MAFLRLKDYELRMQATVLSQYTANATIDKLEAAEEVALAEAKSYLVQKYDLSREFQDTNVFDNTIAYKANQLVELDAPAYAIGTAYTVGKLVSFSGVVYICIQAGTGEQPDTHPLFWTVIGNQYDLYYTTIPYPYFDYRTVYNAGITVFYKDKNYTSLLPSPLYDHDDLLQVGRLEAAPLYNVFPDDPIDGAKFWGAGTPYSVAIGVLPSDASKWTKGDNRDAQLKICLIDMAIFHMAPSLAPRNTPEERHTRYSLAVKWLVRAKDGEVTANLPLFQPLAGRRIRYGGNVKNINSY